MRIGECIEFIFLRVYYTLKAESRRYYLNTLWWILEPLLFMGIFYLIFSRAFSTEVGDYRKYVLVGVSFWFWFNRSVQGMSNSLYNARKFIMESDLPILIYVFEVALKDLVKQLFVVLVLFAFLVFFDGEFRAHWLLVVFVINLQFLLHLIIGIVLSLIVPVFYDLVHIISAALRLGFFVSGVFYNIENYVSGEFSRLLFLNPMYLLIREYRNILVLNMEPHFTTILFYSCGLFLTVVCLSYLVTRNQRKYNKYLTC